MPIKPENKARYPKDWPEIRSRILERAGHQCEWCGVTNGWWVVRCRETGDVLATGPTSGEAMAQQLVGVREHLRVGKLPVRVVLTIAHIHDPNPENCADENLAALCQQCHNRHDAPMRKQNAAETRRAKKTRHQPAFPEARP